MSSTDQIHTSHRTPRGRSALRWTALVAAAATGVLVVTQLSGGLPGSVGSAAPVTCTGPAHVVDVVVAPEVRQAVTAVVAGLNRIDAKSQPLPSYDGAGRSPRPAGGPAARRRGASGRVGAGQHPVGVPGRRGGGAS